MASQIHRLRRVLSPQEAEDNLFSLLEGAGATGESSAFVGKVFIACVESFIRRLVRWCIFFA